MKKILQLYRRIIEAIGKFELAFGITFLAIMVSCIFAQVFSRYGLGRPLKWVEEFSTYCFIWATYVGAAYALKQARHIRILTFVDILPAGVKIFLSFFTYICIIFFLVYGVKYGIAQARMEAVQTTIALPVRLSRKYFYSTPLVFACISMLMTCVYFILEDIAKLFRKK
jgi:TRAP-type C4-dicarboxylate transport system permease small subunit